MAWEFNAVLPRYFERNRPEWVGYKIPVIAPLPEAGSSTAPMFGSHLKGPFIYAVCDNEGHVLYIGKSREKRLTNRWIRPDRVTGKHYWSHGTTGKPNSSKPKTVERIAEHIRSGKGNIRLMFTDYLTLHKAVIERAVNIGADVSALKKLTDIEFNNQIEALLINEFNPAWNTSQPHVSSLMKSCGHYWKGAEL
jgi:hypothetical protein